MAINLNDITDAVQAYLNTKVTVAITELTPGSGDSVNPGESFEVHIEATNADAKSGGVALKNLKYRVSVDDGSVAKLVAPGSLIVHTTDLDGNTLAEGDERKAMIIENVAFSKLAVGATLTQVVTGKAGKAASGGTTNVKVRVLADIDLDALFPLGENTPETSIELDVEG